MNHLEQKIKELIEEIREDILNYRLINPEDIYKNAFINYKKKKEESLTKEDPLTKGDPLDVEEDALTKIIKEETLGFFNFRSEFLMRLIKLCRESTKDQIDDFNKKHEKFYLYEAFMWEANDFGALNIPKYEEEFKKDAHPMRKEILDETKIKKFLQKLGVNNPNDSTMQLIKEEIKSSINQFVPYDFLENGTWLLANLSSRKDANNPEAFTRFNEDIISFLSIFDICASQLATGNNCKLLCQVHLKSPQARLDSSDYQYCLDECLEYPTLDVDFVNNFLQLSLLKEKGNLPRGRKDKSLYFQKCKFKALYLGLDLDASNDDNAYVIGYIVDDKLMNNATLTLSDIANDITEEINPDGDKFKKYQEEYKKWEEGNEEKLKVKEAKIEADKNAAKERSADVLIQLSSLDNHSEFNKNVVDVITAKLVADAIIDVVKDSPKNAKNAENAENAELAAAINRVIIVFHNQYKNTLEAENSIDQEEFKKAFAVSWKEKGNSLQALQRMLKYEDLRKLSEKAEKQFSTQDTVKYDENGAQLTLSWEDDIWEKIQRLPLFEYAQLENEHEENIRLLIDLAKEWKYDSKNDNDSKKLILANITLQIFFIINQEMQVVNGKMTQVMELMCENLYKRATQDRESYYQLPKIYEELKKTLESSNSEEKEEKEKEEEISEKEEEKEVKENKLKESKGFFAVFTNIFFRIAAAITSIWQYIKDFFVTREKEPEAIHKQEMHIQKLLDPSTKIEHEAVSFGKNIFSKIESFTDTEEDERNIFAIQAFWFCNIIHYKYIQKALEQDGKNQELQEALGNISTSILRTNAAIKKILSEDHAFILNDDRACFTASLLNNNSHLERDELQIQKYVDKIDLQDRVNCIPTLCSLLYGDQTEEKNSSKTIKDFLEENFAYLLPISKVYDPITQGVFSTAGRALTNEDAHKMVEISQQIAFEFQEMASDTKRGNLFIVNTLDSILKTKIIQRATSLPNLLDNDIPGGEVIPKRIENAPFLFVKATLKNLNDYPKNKEEINNYIFDLWLCNLIHYQHVKEELKLKEKDLELKESVTIRTNFVIETWKKERVLLETYGPLSEKETKRIKEIQDIEGKIASLEEELKESVKKQEKNKKEIQDIKGEITKLEEEIKESVEKQEKHKKEKEDVDAVHGKILNKKEIDNMQGKIINLREKIENILIADDKEIQDIKGKIANLEEKLENILTADDKEIQDIKGKIANIKAALSSIENYIISNNAIIINNPEYQTVITKFYPGFLAGSEDLVQDENAIEEYVKNGSAVDSLITKRYVRPEMQNMSEEEVKQLVEISRLISDDFVEMSNLKTEDKLKNYFSSEKHRTIAEKILHSGEMTKGKGSELLKISDDKSIENTDNSSKSASVAFATIKQNPEFKSSDSKLDVDAEEEIKGDLSQTTLLTENKPSLTPPIIEEEIETTETNPSLGKKEDNTAKNITNIVEEIKGAPITPIINTESHTEPKDIQKEDMSKEGDVTHTTSDSLNKNEIGKDSQK